jgi:hypothetical protein
MLVDKIAPVLPCKFHARVTRAVRHCHGLPWRRCIASIHVEDRCGWNCRRGCHVISKPFFGLRYGPAGLRDPDCRCLSWRGDGALDEGRASVAERRFCDCASASWDRRVRGRDLLNCCCLCSSRQNTRVNLHHGLRRSIRRDGFTLQGAREIDCGALANSSKCNGGLGARVGDGGS